MKYDRMFYETNAKILDDIERERTVDEARALFDLNTKFDLDNYKTPVKTSPTEQDSTFEKLTKKKTRRRLPTGHVVRQLTFDDAGVSDVNRKVRVLRASSRTLRGRNPSKRRMV